MHANTSARIVSVDFLHEMLRLAVETGASDLHLTAGTPPVLRIHGRLWRVPELLEAGPEAVRKQAAVFLSRWPDASKPVTPEDATLLSALFLREARHEKAFKERGNADLAYSVPGLSRFRVNVFKQRGVPAVACRVLPYEVPKPEDLFPYAPEVVDAIRFFSTLPRGLVLVTGPTGSGKSTTLAMLVDIINASGERHIVTLEDPIEYLHKHKRGVVNQREVGQDVPTFAEGLRAALRQDPDVILVGEMRDVDTISTALAAAETGHLVLSTLHTNTAAETVERIVDVFPPYQQQQVKVQLAAVLCGVLSQQLLPRRDGKGRVCAVEVLKTNHAVRALIREGKAHQIPSIVQTSAAEGMVPMDKALANIVAANLVHPEAAAARAVEPALFRSYLAAAGVRERGDVIL